MLIIFNKIEEISFFISSENASIWKYNYLCNIIISLLNMC